MTAYAGLGLQQYRVTTAEVMRVPAVSGLFVVLLEQFVT